MVIRRSLQRGGEDVLKQRVWMPSYVYAFHPLYGYYPYTAMQEYEIEY